MIEVNQVTLGYRQRNGAKEVLRNLSFCWEKGELLCILGANGAGKTTLYRTILGLLPRPGRENFHRRRGTSCLWSAGSGKEDRLCAPVSQSALPLSGF